MPKAVQCPQCGNRYPFNPKLAGQTVLCAGCGGAIQVPAAAAVQADTITCGGCGASYRRNPALAGKQIPCPACGQKIQIPAAQQPATRPAQQPATVTSHQAGTQPLLPPQRKTAPAAPSRDLAPPKPSPSDLQLAPLDDAPKSTSPVKKPAAGSAPPSSLAATRPAMHPAPPPQSPTPPTAPPKPSPPEESDLQLMPIEELDNPKAAKKLKPQPAPQPAPSSILTPLEQSPVGPMPGVPIDSIPLTAEKPAVASTASFFNDELQQAQARAEEEAAPPPPGKKKKKKKKRKRYNPNDGTFITRTMVPVILAIGFVIGLLTAIFTKSFLSGLQAAFGLYHLTALISVMAGGVWGLILAFGEDPMQGVLYMFVPFYSLYYNYTRRDTQPHPYQLMFGALAYWGGLVVVNILIVVLYIAVMFGIASMAPRHSPPPTRPSHMRPIGR